MIVERHYDDEALIDIAHSGDEGGMLDPHLVSCPTCSESLASFRAIADVLGDSAVWDLRELREEPSPATMSNLRQFVSRRNSESAVAVSMLDALLELPSENWLPTAKIDSRYRNAEVVRELISRSEDTLDVMPPDAVTMGRAALAIADSMEESDVVLRLRGAAARQLAYSLFIVGDPVEALTYVDVSQRAFDRCAVADYDIARLHIVRAMVYRMLERYDEALSLTHTALQIFEAYGDEQRIASALIAEAYLLLHLNRYREALPILRRVESRLGPRVDPKTLSITRSNIAFCLWQMGEIQEAMTAYEVAAALDAELGDNVGAARIRYNVAALLASRGQFAEARRRFRALREEIRSLGLKFMAVAVDLELAELMLLDKNYDEAERLCRNVVGYSQRAGLSHTENVATALSYLQEAAAQKRLNRETIRHVKRYVERLESQPALLFAPPPTEVR